MAASASDRKVVDQEAYSSILKGSKWFQNHPKLTEMYSWGFEDNSKLLTVLIVYLDLCEAKTWWNIIIHRCDALQTAYITGRPDKKANYLTVLPISAEEEDICVKRLEEFLHIIPLPPPRTDENLNTSEIEPPNTVTLAIVDSDSTIVYYTISNGLQQPKNLEVVGPDDEVGTTKNKPKSRNKKNRWKKKKKSGS